MIRVAVVGAGAMGRNHIRVYQSMPEVELVAVVDKSEEALASMSNISGVPVYADYMEMVDRERPQAVSVVVPTVAHYTIVRDLLQAGCHVLVEKPIAATLSEAEQLILTASRHGRVLMVGHIERFNPAVIALKERLDRGELGHVFQIHARRLGPFPTRVRDVGVIMDLATHDLDIMRYLTGSDVTRLFAETSRKVHSSYEDMLDGIVRFDNGAVGLLEINWLTPTKIRELYVTGEHGLFRVNYITQDLYFFQNAATTEEHWSPLSLLRGVREGMMVKYPIEKKEPLRSELESFVREVKTGDSFAANGDDGHAALALAVGMIESAKLGQVMYMHALAQNSEPGHDRNKSASRGYRVPWIRNQAQDVQSIHQARS